MASTYFQVNIRQTRNMNLLDTIAFASKIKFSKDHNNNKSLTN
jgi:hypothetical protein